MNSSKMMKLTILFTYLLGSTLALADPIISEFLADSDQGFEDENGDASDWIVVYNPDATSVSLNGWSLTDDVAQPSKWTFPNVSIAAGARLVVFASCKDRSVGELHTNFSLSANGEYLALVKPGGAKISEFNLYPEQKTDISYGVISSTNTLVSRSSALKYVLTTPANDAQGDTWTENDYDDSLWTDAAVSENVFNSTAPVGILDHQTVNSNVSVSGMSGVIQDVNVTVDVSHTFCGTHV